MECLLTTFRLNMSFQWSSTFIRVLTRLNINYISQSTFPQWRRKAWHAKVVNSQEKKLFYSKIIYCNIQKCVKEEKLQTLRSCTLVSWQRFLSFWLSHFFLHFVDHLGYRSNKSSPIWATKVFILPIDLKHETSRPTQNSDATLITTINLSSIWLYVILYINCFQCW